MRRDRWRRLSASTDFALLISGKLIRFQMPSLMDDRQDFDQVIGLDLIENPLGIQRQLADSVVIQLWHPPA